MGLGRVPEGIIYLLLLLWTFFGVAIVADIFMTAIEQVTSQTYTVKQIIDGTTRRFRVKVWNDTVANLTLMALGSSAPEILLSVIEICGRGMRSGELGPSTIVGSAAFNMLVIIAVCVVAIPASDVRKIEDLKVYCVTSIFSVLAYVWLVLILLAWSPNIITPIEALITLLLFPVLVWIAFMADKSKDPTYAKKHPLLRWCAPTAAPVAPISAFLLDIKRPDGTALKADELAAIVKRLKGNQLHGMSEEETARAISSKLREQQPKSRAFYRIHATRGMTGGKALLKRSGSLSQGIMRKMKSFSMKAEDRFSLRDAAEMSEVELHATTPPNETTPAVEFAAARYAIIEAAGTVTLQVRRRGPLDGTASVAYATKDGTAVAVEDYVAKSGTLTFGPGEDTAEIVIEIIDDDIEEDDEHFTVELSARRAASPSAPSRRAP